MLKKLLKKSTREINPLQSMDFTNINEAENLISDSQVTGHLERRQVLGESGSQCTAKEGARTERTTFGGDEDLKEGPGRQAWKDDLGE